MFPQKYQEKMSIIKEYLQCPEDYVESQENFDEYKEIIIERIIAKIEELKSLNQNQKMSYIQIQAHRKAQITQNQQIMSQHKPPVPGSDAHVMLELEWQRQMERRINPRFLNNPRSRVREENIPILPSVQEAIDAGIITLEQYLEIPFDMCEMQLNDLMERASRNLTI